MSDLNPMISIVVPVYNVCKYVDKCLQSLINQTYKNLEIIVIDDGSNDGSSLICDAFALRDSRIKVFHQENGGLSRARNKGLENVHGEYIGFVDSDDYVDVDMYQCLYNNIVKYDADISICAHYIEKINETETQINDNDIVLLDSPVAMQELVKDKMIRSYVWDKLYKASLFTSIKFPEGRVFEDIYVSIRVFRLSKKVVFLRTPKYHYVQRPGSILHTANYNYAMEYQYLRSLVEQYDIAKHENVELSEHITLKPLKKSIHFINHLTTFPLSPTFNEYRNYAVSVIRKYDEYSAWQIGIWFGIRRFLILNYPYLYRALYRLYKILWNRK